MRICDRCKESGDVRTIRLHNIDTPMDLVREADLCFSCREALGELWSHFMDKIEEKDKKGG